jgi:uncharacterized protein YggU (UPF0235/DUF167 family)
MRGAEKLAIRDQAGGAAIAVKAVAGASRDRVVGVLGDALKITTAAPAERGKANAALAAALAEVLGVSGHRVRLAAGGGNTRKTFHVAGLSADQVRQALASSNP